LDATFPTKYGVSINKDGEPVLKGPGAHKPPATAMELEAALQTLLSEWCSEPKLNRGLETWSGMESSSGIRRTPLPTLGILRALVGGLGLLAGLAAPWIGVARRRNATLSVGGDSPRSIGGGESHLWLAAAGCCQLSLYLRICRESLPYPVYSLKRMDPGPARLYLLCFAYLSIHLNGHYRFRGDGQIIDLDAIIAGLDMGDGIF
jgi:hypothetical protein